MWTQQTATCTSLQKQRTQHKSVKVAFNYHLIEAEYVEPNHSFITVVLVLVLVATKWLQAQARNM